MSYEGAYLLFQAHANYGNYSVIQSRKLTTSLKSIGY